MTCTLNLIRCKEHNPHYECGLYLWLNVFEGRYLITGVVGGGGGVDDVSLPRSYSYSYYVKLLLKFIFYYNINLSRLLLLNF